MPVSIEGRAVGGAFVEGTVVVGGAVAVVVGDAIVERTVVVGGAVGPADLVELPHPVAKTAMPAQEKATIIYLARAQPPT
jgi:hypothetical protein